MRTRTTDKDRANIASVETFFDELLRGKLTDNLFFEELPVSLKKTWKELVVVDLHNVMRDHDAYAKQTVLIQMFVKPNPYGIKDVKTMQKLESKLNELIHENSHPHYAISTRGTYAGYDAVNDIYYDIVQLHLIVK